MNARVEGLSCYTANLALYLSQHGDALDRIARSVRLAVRTDLPEDLLAFSHHRMPLNVLGEGSRLEYASAAEPGDALDGVGRELAARGQVLAVSNTATMDWSVPGNDPVPHFLLIDDRLRDQWHVVDRFTALHPEGRQVPFAGWLGSPGLRRCLTPVTPLPPVHRLRNEHAFGFPVRLPPEGHYQWLVRVDGSRGDGPVAELPGRWTAGPDVLDLLEEFWTSLGARPSRARHLDDMWAAAQHHTFQYTHLRCRTVPSLPEAAVLAEAAAAWRDLPMALHFAYQSARRGRPRPAMVKATFDRLRRAELPAAELAAAAGYGASTRRSATEDWILR